MISQESENQGEGLSIEEVDFVLLLRALSSNPHHSQRLLPARTGCRWRMPSRLAAWSFHRVEEGEDPDLVLLELYANAEQVR